MTAKEIITKWNAMTAEQQENYCKAAVATALNDRYHLSTGYTFEDAAQDTFLRVLEAISTCMTNIAGRTPGTKRTSMTISSLRSN